MVLVGGLCAAKISFFDFVTGFEFFACACENDAAAFQNVCSVSDGKCHFGVLFNKKDCCAHLVEFLDDVKDALNKDRCKTH